MSVMVCCSILVPVKCLAWDTCEAVPFHVMRTFLHVRVWVGACTHIHRRHNEIVSTHTNK